MKLLYSTEAMISVDGKNYKGTLDCFDDRLVLHNDNKTLYQFVFSIDDVEITTGITKVVFLNLYTKEKTFFKLSNSSAESMMLFVSAEDASAIEKVVKDHKNNVNKGKTTLDFPIYEEKHIDVFLKNPFRVLGIPSNATDDEIDTAFQKIKKLIRLNVVKTYKTDYSLALFKEPERDIATCQNSVAEMKNVYHKWFWFNTSEACRKWEEQSFRDYLTMRGVENAEYDLFLSQYLFGLVFDSSFRERNIWYSILAYIQDIIGNNNVEKLKEKILNGEKIAYSDEELLISFQNTIFNPLKCLIEDSDIDSQLNLYRTLRMDRFPKLKEVKRYVGGRIVNWYNEAEKTAMEVSGKYLGTGRLSADSAYEVWLTAQKYEESVQESFLDTLAAFTMAPVRAEIIKESYGKVMHSFAVLLAAGNRREDGIKYANFAYPYVDAEKKQKLRDIFGIEKIKDADQDLTPQEMDSIGDDYYYGRNGKQQDYNQAFFWFSRAAEKGNMYSQNSLGICYLKGFGVEIDEEKSTYWFSKAADQGATDAMCNLARAYFYGRGVIIDKEKAVELVDRAIELGFEKAKDLRERLLAEK